MRRRCSIPAPPGRARRPAPARAQDRAGVRGGCFSAPGPSIDVEHVLPVANHVGAVVEQAVRPRGGGGTDPARHRADLPVQVLGHRRRDQRAGSLPRLDHHRHPAERRHDPVARREGPAARRGPRRQLAQHQPALHDLLVEPRAARRIGDVHAGAEHRDRQPAGLQSAPRCAQESMPIAMPLTTTIPAAPTCWPELGRRARGRSCSGAASRRSSRRPRGAARRAAPCRRGRRGRRAGRRARRAPPERASSWRQQAQAPAAGDRRAHPSRVARCGALEVLPRARAPPGRGPGPRSGGRAARAPGCPACPRTAFSMWPASEPISQARRRHSVARARLLAAGHDLGRSRRRERLGDVPRR